MSTPAPPRLSNQDLLILIGDQTVTIATLRARVQQLEAELAQRPPSPTSPPSPPPGPVD